MNENKDKDAAEPITKTQLQTTGKVFVLGFCFIVLTLIVTGHTYVRHEQTHAKIAAAERLTSIASLKQRQLGNWREERLSDAWFFSHAPFVATDIEHLLEDPDSQSNHGAILRWLKLLKGGDRYYGVALFDAQLRPLIGSPQPNGIPTVPNTNLVAQVIQNKEPVMSDMRLETPNGLIHLDILFPIFRDPDSREDLLGFGLLSLDARQFLFRLIQTWPTASRTAEALLIRREGDEVLYLNDLRHQSGTAMRLRKPISLSQLSAARCLQGDTNATEGIDYRGVPVVAVGRAVPGTPWVIVTKVDQEELYAPFRREAFWVYTVLATFLSSSALLMALLWRQRGHEFLRRELASERRRFDERKVHEKELERMNRLYAALSQVNQTIVRVRSREELLDQVCQVLVEFGGFEMAWLGWVDSNTHRVLPVAQFGHHLEYLHGIEVYADDRPEGRGPIGMAIRTCVPCVCNLLRDPGMEPWRERLNRCGWVSVAAFPVYQEGKACAALAIYSQDPDHFAPKESALLTEAASDISFGLDVLLNNIRRQRAEEELRRLNTELEERVRQRTVALENKNRELECFTYSVSHDLKAPLRGIEGFSKMLLEDHANQLDEVGLDYLSRIAQSAQRMGQMIRDLLEYSRLEIQAPQPSSVDVRQIVQHILDDFGVQVAESKTQVSLDIQGLPLETDPQGLEQALRNLIGNAIKFSAKQAVPRVAIIGRDENGQYKLEVRDNGIGFDVHDKEKLFQIFQRLQSSRGYPGTGIGLAIVRKAIERVGGSVRADSEPGKGASFILKIPRHSRANESLAVTDYFKDAVACPESSDSRRA